MSTVRSFRDPAPEPVRLEVRAADNLRFIRETMENAGRFTAVPGWGGVGMGVTALAVAIAGCATVLKARAAKVQVFSAAGRRFALSFVPPLLVGALLTIVLYQ